MMRLKATAALSRLLGVDLPYMWYQRVAYATSPHRGMICSYTVYREEGDANGR